MIHGHGGSNKGYDVAVIGAGPSGLTAAALLARAGASVVVLERLGVTGGLMASVHRDGFTFDLGRKQLHTRFPEVHGLWQDLLGNDYRPYTNRIGSLHTGRILERSSEPRGKLRGLRLTDACRVAVDYVATQMRPRRHPPRNLEEYYLSRYGRVYYEHFQKAFLHKFSSVQPSMMPAPKAHVPRFVDLLSANPPTRQGRPQPRWEWRHPARGTGQITDSLERQARLAGAEFHLNSEVVGVCARAGRVDSVVVRRGAGHMTLRAERVVSSLPLTTLLRNLDPAPPATVLNPPPKTPRRKRAVALVYLILDGPPPFPHTCLLVNDPRLRVGRIVNFAALNGDMVPPGKTSLCFEYFCGPHDPLLRLPDHELIELATAEAERSHLLARTSVVDGFVLKLPHVNPITSSGYWHSEWTRLAAKYLKGIENLYDVNRPGMDRATLAGIDAATACCSGEQMHERSLFISQHEQFV